jgi:hypothetical protein
MRRAYLYQRTRPTQGLRKERRLEYIGFFALGIGVLGYFFTNPRDVLKFSIPSAAMWVLYFFHLGVWTAIATSLLALLRLVCGGYFGDRLMRAGSLMILVVLVGVFLWNHPGWAAVLPIVAAIWKTASLWLRDRHVLFRLSLIGAETALLLFAYQVTAGALALSSILVILINGWKIHSIAREETSGGQRQVVLEIKKSNLIRPANPEAP